MTNPNDDPTGDHAEAAGLEVGAATTPITLTDPDGAVTRVAPWSTWSREQVRAPGGEPALVTRLDQGQLWFAAGRQRSPWRHEVKVGPATVSTPRGRFHVTAESDGGATIACLAGRTRVATALREPVILGPDQTAAVASDGATLVVMDRANNADHTFPLDEWSTDALGTGLAHEADAEAGVPGDLSSDPADALPVPVVLPASVGVAARARRGRRRTARTTAPSALAGGRRGPLRWLPETAAGAALLAVLVAAVVVFGRGGTVPDEIVAAPVRTTAPGDLGVPSTTGAPDPDPDADAASDPGTDPGAAAPATTEPTVPITEPAPPTSEARRSPTTTEAPTPDRAVATTSPPPAAPPATVASPPVTTGLQPSPTVPAVTGPPGTASGTLVSCRRTDGGVLATIEVQHETGGPGVFRVDVGLVDRTGDLFAQAATATTVVERGGETVVDVLVPAEGRPRGACELLGVTST